MMNFRLVLVPLMLLLVACDEVTVEKVAVNVTLDSARYANEIDPLLTEPTAARTGQLSCAASGCHSTNASVGNFGLSVNTAELNFSGVFTRANLADPSKSLLLLKPLAVSAGGVSHGGGNLFESTNNADYLAILAWISSPIAVESDAPVDANN